MSFPAFSSIHVAPHVLCPHSLTLACTLPCPHAVHHPCTVPCPCAVPHPYCISPSCFHVVIPSCQEVKSSHIQLQSPSDSIIQSSLHSLTVFQHACPQISDGFVRQGVIGFYFSLSESFWDWTDWDSQYFKLGGGVLECTGSVQETGVNPTFRTAYVHPEKQHKAWFGLFQLQGVRSYFRNISGVIEMSKQLFSMESSRGSLFGATGRHEGTWQRRLCMLHAQKSIKPNLGLNYAA